MRKTRILAVAVAVIGGAYLAWTGYARPAREAAVAAELRDPSNHSPNYTYDGIILASAPMESNEQAGILGSLMGVHMQKFNAKMTKPLPRVAFNLELREIGQPVKVLASFKFGPFGGDPNAGLSALYVAILPMNGSLSESEKIKIAVYSGGISSNSVTDNPFKGAFSYGSPDPGSGGKDIPLWGARFVPNNNGSSTTSKTMVLRLDTNPGH